MGQLVGQALHLVRVEASVVRNDVVRSGGHTSLGHTLADDEEVIPAKTAKISNFSRVR
jgi:hypothetical protein